jgi:hypothetical protein
VKIKTKTTFNGHLRFEFPVELFSEMTSDKLLTVARPTKLDGKLNTRSQLLLTVIVVASAAELSERHALPFPQNVRLFHQKLHDEER